MIYHSPQYTLLISTCKHQLNLELLPSSSLSLKAQVSYIIVPIIICCSIMYHYLGYYAVMLCFPKKILSCPTLPRRSRNLVSVC